MQKVVVSVGTDHHPFDRMIDWVERWAARHQDLDVFIQRGTSRLPKGYDSAELIPHAELCDRFAEADLVIAHGGPSTVMDARSSGRTPIVVPRDPELGEHVDGHQLAFGQHLVKHSFATVANTYNHFEEVADAHLGDPEKCRLEQSVHSQVGIVGFGRQLDELLGISTPLVRSGSEAMSS